MADEFTIDNQSAKTVLLGYKDSGTGETRVATEELFGEVTLTGDLPDTAGNDISVMRGNSADSLLAVEDINASMGTVLTRLTTIASQTAPVSTIGNGDTLVVAAAATPEQLTSSSTPAKWVYLRALDTNTDVVGWGGSGIAANGGDGPQLAAGEDIFIPVSNANLLYISVAVNGEGVAWSYGV